MGFIVPLSDRQYSALQSLSVNTTRSDRRDGEIHFEYDNFEVHIPSSNYKVKFKLEDHKFVYDPDNKKTVMEAGFPHIRFEFSAPKVLFKHNLVSIDIGSALDACFRVKEAFQKEFTVKLPSLKAWFLNRVDVCANFVLGSGEEVKRYIRHLQRMEYPRRIQNLYSDSGMYFGSRHNTLKIYAKGPEFKRNDFKRFLSQEEAWGLLGTAEKIFRVECELKGRIKYLHEKYIAEASFGESLEYPSWSGYPLVYDFLEYVDIKGELQRMLETFLIGKETSVMKSAEVLERLRFSMSVKQADAFHHVYMVMVTDGMLVARERFGRNKLRRAKVAFRTLGISLVSDVVRLEKKEMGFPSDLSLEMSERNRYYQVPLRIAA